MGEADGAAKLQLQQLEVKFKERGLKLKKLLAMRKDSEASHAQALDKIRATNSAQLENLIAEKNTLEANFKNVSDQLQEATAAMDATQSELQNLYAHNETLVFDAQRASDQLNEVNGALNAAESELCSLRSQNANLASDVQKTSEQLMQAEATMASMQSQIDTRSSLHADELEGLRNQNAHLSTSAQHNAEQLNETLAALAATRAELDAAKERTSLSGDLESKAFELERTERLYAAESESFKRPANTP